jgi:hypothetical protein
MAEMTSAGGPGGPGPTGLSREQEEAAFYHEAALNATWTGSRLMIGIVTSGLGAFIFAFFYLRSVNSYGLWYPSSLTPPNQTQGAIIMGLVVVSAIVQSLGLSGSSPTCRSSLARLVSPACSSAPRLCSPR